LPISVGAMEEAKTGWYLETSTSLSEDIKFPDYAFHRPRNRKQEYTITLMGDGGVGKSSMALRVGHGTSPHNIPKLRT
jgi:GTPase SAR1 family protein